MYFIKKVLKSMNHNRLGRKWKLRKKLGVKSNVNNDC